MSFQIVCDNCGDKHIYSDGKMPHHVGPSNWELIYGSEKTSGYQQHLCPECVKAKDIARWSAQDQIRKAEEAALASRRKS